MGAPEIQSRKQNASAGERSDSEPVNAFAEDGVDLTLIHWFLSLSPYERLQTAQDMIDTAWKLREAK